MANIYNCDSLKRFTEIYNCNVLLKYILSFTISEDSEKSIKYWYIIDIYIYDFILIISENKYKVNLQDV